MRQFLKERTYLKNVTPRTLVWYHVAFKNYRAMVVGDATGWATNNHYADDHAEWRRGRRRAGNGWEIDGSEVLGAVGHFTKPLPVLCWEMKE